MPRLTFVAALLLALMVSAAQAQAEKRVALVIGNDDYRHLPDLRNAGKDAEGIASKLESLGFDVILKLNARERDMVRALSAFESRLTLDSTGLVFFAGHGIQSEGTNYLIPVDADVEVEADLASEAVPASAFLQTMERAGNALNIVILDACRDNPLPRRARSAARGLTVVGLPSGVNGTAILYAAGPGQAAEDGPEGGHGVFTGELLKAMDQPGLKLEELFKGVSRQVLERTNGRQRPWSLTSLQGDFYFRKGPKAGASGGLDKEALYWSSIQAGTDAADFESYLRKYPSGTFADLARNRLAALTPRSGGERPAAKPEEGTADKAHAVFERTRPAWTRPAADADAIRNLLGEMEVFEFQTQQMDQLIGTFDKALTLVEEGRAIGSRVQLEQGPFDILHELERVEALFGAGRCLALAPMSVDYTVPRKGDGDAVLMGSMERSLYRFRQMCVNIKQLIADARYRADAVGLGRTDARASVGVPVRSLAVTPMRETRVSTATSNIRAEPSPRAGKLGQLKPGQRVDVTGRTEVADETWYRIALPDGGFGYVFGNLLEETQGTVDVPYIVERLPGRAK